MKLNVDDVFTYQPPDEFQIIALKRVRMRARDLAQTILDEVPDCADQQAALRLLRECVRRLRCGVSSKE